MFLDSVVLAGIGTVALMFVFFAGVGYFIYRDSHKTTTRVPTKKGPH